MLKLDMSNNKTRDCWTNQNPLKNKTMNLKSSFFSFQGKTTGKIYFYRIMALAFVVAILVDPGANPIKSNIGLTIEG